MYQGTQTHTKYGLAFILLHASHSVFNVQLKNMEACKCVWKSISRPVRLCVTHYYKQLNETLGIFVCIQIPHKHTKLEIT
jgi:hypothetical protein